jgi:hypothetical protein
MTAQKDNLVPLPPESGKAGTALWRNCFPFASVLGIRKKNTILLQDVCLV